MYSIVGTYHALYKKSRLFEFTKTFVCSLIGCVILFFAFILDDTENNNTYYYLAFLYLFSLHFTLTFLGRWIWLNKVKGQLLRGDVFFNTLMVGSQDNAIRIYKETGRSLHDGGYRYLGFVTPDVLGKNGIHQMMPKLGSLEELENIIDLNLYMVKGLPLYPTRSCE